MSGTVVRGVTFTFILRTTTRVGGIHVVAVRPVTISFSDAAVGPAKIGAAVAAVAVVVARALYAGAAGPHAVAAAVNFRAFAGVLRTAASVVGRHVIRFRTRAGGLRHTSVVVPHIAAAVIVRAFGAAVDRTASVVTRDINGSRFRAGRLCHAAVVRANIGAVAGAAMRVLRALTASAAGVIRLGRRVRRAFAVAVRSAASVVGRHINRRRSRAGGLRHAGAVIPHIAAAVIARAFGAAVDRAASVVRGHPNRSRFRAGTLCHTISAHAIIRSAVAGIELRALRVRAACRTGIVRTTRRASAGAMAVARALTARAAVIIRRRREIRRAFTVAFRAAACVVGRHVNRRGTRTRSLSAASAVAQTDQDGTVGAGCAAFAVAGASAASVAGRHVNGRRTRTCSLLFANVIVIRLCGRC